LSNRNWHIHCSYLFAYYEICNQRVHKKETAMNLEQKNGVPTTQEFAKLGMSFEMLLVNKLEGKIALVTGGSRGIGAAIAKRLATDGAKVAITYAKGADAAAAVVKEIERDGGKAIAIQADATDAKASKAAVEKTMATFGQLDVLVNNAGTAIPKTFEETTLEEMDRVIDINIRGVFIATQAALKHMRSGGRIIMIGSSVGERVVVPGLVPYAATKG